MVFEYTILLVFLIVVFILVILIPFFSTTVVYQENYQEKISSYECGFEPFETYMSQFEVRYYLVAILFLIFDIELVFLMPWILAFHYISAYLLLSMATFFFFLLIAFYYEWLIGGLE